MELLFTGTSSVLPEPHRDTASFLVDRTILVDCGWWTPLGMRHFGANPLAIEHLFLTHCHHDHVMALPQLLFFQRNRSDAAPLKIWGPAGDVERIVNLALAFLRAERLAIQVEVTPFPLEQGLELGELRVTVCPSIHPVPGFSYRFDAPDGRSLVLSGDTAYNERLIELARDADVLVHEASHGASTPELNPALHAGGREAAEIARMAGVKRLFLSHVAETKRQDALDAAMASFPASEVATEGLRVSW